ncbi:MAG: hypothetical protein VKL41_21080 [Snowella sp.]|nr:hypothetical protein [Snowella sp.]
MPNCLRENYFPVAHDLVIHQDIIKNNIASPVWAHSLVQLCKTEYLQEALKKQKFYDECAYLDEISTGDYCGFNFLESVAKSAIQARLSAILKTQIDPNQYIRDLSQTIQQEEILKIAENYLTYYPFSLRAMESYLQTYLLDRCEGLASYGCMKALLLITRGYLQEGLYRKASGFLKKVKNELDSKVSKVLSGSTLAEYELCKANYFYFFNTKDTTDRTIFNLDNTERGTLVNESWNSLNKAESYIKTRLTKYWTIKETSQSIFHPHFIILARINFIKAKLFLFFPSYATIKIGENDDLQNFHYARLYFLERARIYAAKNGNTVDYACYTAYQVFAYTMTGYLVNKKQSLKSNREVDFTKEICLKKAQKLRDNALICYAEFGKQCYYEIKEKSGISVNKIYGKYQVERLPLIQEENAERSQQVISQGWEDGILHIDMSLLHMKTLDDSNDLLQESIYLFGAKAAIILFARAIYELCSDDNMEKISSLKAKFRKAYRLFTYAWAIAEDGCDTVESETEDYDYKIIRPYLQPTYEKEELFPPEAESVRDLYPHRQSEIADLGKIFAIACHLLKLYLIDHIDEEKQSVINKINYLKEKLKKPSNPNSEDEDNDVQNEFNEHLAHYFVKINKSINDELIHAQKNKYIASTDGIKKVRQRIMTNFCDFL